MICLFGLLLRKKPSYWPTERESNMQRSSVRSLPAETALLVTLWRSSCGGGQQMCRPPKHFWREKWGETFHTQLVWLVVSDFLFPHWNDPKWLSYFSRRCLNHQSQNCFKGHNETSTGTCRFWWESCSLKILSSIYNQYSCAFWITNHWLLMVDKPLISPCQPPIDPKP